MTRAVQNLIQPDLLQSQAVDVRMELDLRIGKFQWVQDNNPVCFFQFGRSGTMLS